MVWPSSLIVALKRCGNGSPSRQSFHLPSAMLISYAADAALVGVELEVGSVGCVASHDRDGVGRLGHLHRRALYQVCARVMPFDRGPCLARQWRPVRRLSL